MKKTFIILGALIIAAIAIWFYTHPQAGFFGGSTDIPDNWKTYSNSSKGFSVQFDPTLTQEDSGDDVRFYKWGPTQRGETEMYDGIIVTFHKVNISNSHDDYIDSRVTEFQQVGTITEPLHASDLNGLAVKQFRANSLGDFTLIFIPINSGTLLELSYMAPDPTGAGFQEIIDKMLSTFKLSK